jgi:hypothetical protein
VLGVTLTVFAAVSAPVNDKTLLRPSAADPSGMFNVVVVPVTATATNPSIAVSNKSKLVLVVLPQVPDCSPVAIF